MRVFISHAWEDKPLALELSKLPDFVHVWLDKELAGGQILDRSILSEIEDSHVFIVLVSRKAVTKLWVAKEVEWALDREAEKDRIFVLPVMVERDLDLTTCPMPFPRIASRLFIDASDCSEQGIVASISAIQKTLFHWASDWVERLEPKGDSHGGFVHRLESNFVKYQQLLFAVKAVLAWPLSTFVEEKAVEHLIKAKDQYNQFTDEFIPQLVTLDDEVRWRFGLAALRAFKELTAFIRNEIYHGAAYALNDVIESINAYDAVLSKDPDALAGAETRREARVAALEPAMVELVRRTDDYIRTLKP